MRGREINTKAIVDQWKQELKVRAKQLYTSPRLHIIQVGNNEASNKYIRNKLNVAAEVGVYTEHITLDEGVQQETFNLAARQEGIYPTIIQLPIPGHLDLEEAVDRILVESDVDGFTFAQKGMLQAGKKEALVPATAAGVLRILKETVGYLRGMKVAIVNRSQLIGQPLTQLMLQENAEVILLHSQIPQEQLRREMQAADIVITGCGQRKIFDHSYFRDGQILIDCSMTKSEGVPGVGDMDKEDIMQHLEVQIASGYGHTGPATTMALIDNVIKAYELQMN